MKRILVRPYLVLTSTIGCSIPLGMLIFLSSCWGQAVEQHFILGFLISCGVVASSFAFFFNAFRKFFAWVSFDTSGVHLVYPLKLKKEGRTKTLLWNECEEILFCSENTGDVPYLFVIVFSKEHFKVPDQRRTLVTNLYSPTAKRVYENRKKFYTDEVITVEYRKRVLRELLKYVDKSRILYPDVFAKRKPKDYAKFYGAD